MASITYDLIAGYPGVQRDHIRQALSVLATNALVHIEQVPSSLSEHGIKYIKRACPRVKWIQSFADERCGQYLRENKARAVAKSLGQYRYIFFVKPAFKRDLKTLPRPYPKPETEGH